MNKPSDQSTFETPEVTTGPLPASRKVYTHPLPDLAVPHREIDLHPTANEPAFPVYDTSGPYSDPSVTIDVEKGLDRPRHAWVLERGGVLAVCAVLAPHHLAVKVTERAGVLQRDLQRPVAGLHELQHLVPLGHILQRLLSTLLLVLKFLIEVRLDAGAQERAPIVALAQLRDLHPTERLGHLDRTWALR